MENTINTWAEAIASLPDQQFFNIMRLYLGEIKTPYNKQRLASQLASFIKNSDNTKTIISLLDKTDLEILAGVRFINNVTQENLIQFFGDSYKLSELYTKIANLKERLLIYSVTKDSKELLLLNPILLEALEKRAGINLLLQLPQIAARTYDDVFILSPNFLASYISYLKNHNCALKADGFLKKNDLSKAEEVFPGKQNCFQLLTNAFVNLSLVREGKKGLETDDSKLKLFAKLPEIQQYSLLCAGSCSRFSRDGLKKEAQLLIDCLSSIPEAGFTKKSLLRLAFMLGTRTEDGSAIAKKSRFTQLLEAARAKDNDEAFQNINLLDRMIDSAREFGLIQKTGTDENGEEIFVSGAGNIQPSVSTFAAGATAPKPLNIEATFSASLMPGLSLIQLLPLTSFMDIKNYGIVCQFELSRKSVSNAFDKGWNPDSIFEEIQKYTNYELPQNLKINITEWFNTYSSAVLYQGFVLKVTENNISFAENNPNIQKYVQEKLAPGIYLLNIPSDANINSFLSESGLDFMGNIKTAVNQQESLAFPLLRAGRKFQMIEEASGTEPFYDEVSHIKAMETFINSLSQKLETLPLDKNQKESLKNRINNRLILSETQLSTAAIRAEILEADGMDFAGKVHLIEAAQKEDDLLEIQLPNPDGSKGYITMVGKIEAILRSPSDAILTLQLQPEKESRQIYVSRITHVRRLRF